MCIFYDLVCVFSGMFFREIIISVYLGIYRKMVYSSKMGNYLMFIRGREIRYWCIYIELDSLLLKDIWSGEEKWINVICVIIVEFKIMLKGRC